MTPAAAAAHLDAHRADCVAMHPRAVRAEAVLVLLTTRGREQFVPLCAGCEGALAVGVIARVRRRLRPDEWNGDRLGPPVTEKLPEI